MKAKIAKIILLLPVFALSGCLSSNPDKAQRTISHWIPPGAPQEDAIRIMKHHGFESGKDGWSSNEESVFWFSRETKIMGRMCWFHVHFKNGKVVSIEGLGTANDFFGRFGPHPIPSGA
jgi:hypothetical protein